jgi:ATP/maltotriose-dependent transcriptional regulator MalT
MVRKHLAMIWLCVSSAAAAQSPAAASCLGQAVSSAAEALTTSGEARFGRGELDAAAAAYRQSLSMDVCLARTHLDLDASLELAGLGASGQAELEEQMADLREIQHRRLSRFVDYAGCDGHRRGGRADLRRTR